MRLGDISTHRAWRGDRDSSLLPEPSFPCTRSRASPKPVYILRFRVSGVSPESQKADTSRWICEQSSRVGANTTASAVEIFQGKSHSTGVGELDLGFPMSIGLEHQNLPANLKQA